MFKTKKIHRRSLFMHPVLSLILIDMYWYCLSNNMNFVVTETFTTAEEDKSVNRKHDTHRTGRAFDISVKGWGKKFRKEFCKHFNQKYYNEAALSASTLKRTLCVDHVGTAAHIHVQVDRKFTIDNKEIFKYL